MTEKKHYESPEVQEIEVHADIICSSPDGEAPEYDVITGFTLD